MLHVDVGKNRYMAVQTLSFPKQRCRIAFDQSLIRRNYAGEDIHSDELAARD